MENPIPGWLYLDEKAFLLTGWPGHRTRQGRCGYDPLDTDFEQAHVEGVIIRLLFTQKLRTHNPVYLLLMTYVGLLFGLTLPGVIVALQGDWITFLYIIVYSPYWVFGIALLMNVFFSLRPSEQDDEEKGYTFF
jgi:hypothetical protein